MTWVTRLPSWRVCRSFSCKSRFGREGFARSQSGSKGTGYTGARVRSLTMVSDTANSDDVHCPMLE